MLTKGQHDIGWGNCVLRLAVALLSSYIHSVHAVLHQELNHLQDTVTIQAVLEFPVQHIAARAFQAAGFVTLSSLLLSANMSCIAVQVVPGILHFVSTGMQTWHQQLTYLLQGGLCCASDGLCNSVMNARINALQGCTGFALAGTQTGAVGLGAATKEGLCWHIRAFSSIASIGCVVCQGQVLSNRQCELAKMLCLNAPALQAMQHMTVAMCVTKGCCQLTVTNPKSETIA